VNGVGDDGGVPTRLRSATGYDALMAPSQPAAPSEQGGAASRAGGPATAVFDLDGTLYGTTTTYDVLERLHRGRRTASWWLLRSAGSRWGGRFWRVVERATGRDLLRAVALRTLRGVAVSELEAACRDYVAAVHATALRGTIAARLEAYREAGALIVLASASFEPLVAEVARRLGADAYVASRPGERDGRCTGAWASDVRARKHAALRERLGAFAPFAVVTDNVDDDDLIAAASEVVIVTHPRHRASWRKRLSIDAEFVEV
jgi:HAD superfamily phosphoserine phosphatase-like hydrolase